MPRIERLPPDVVARIAAGEVIERPASVFKELVENSLDAGAGRIEIEVAQGGLESLCVADNGGGIVAEDLPLAFAPHATSKLRSSDDLFHIGTLGFRGEGLASIGGVARVRLQSRPVGTESGAEVECNGGIVGAVRPWAGSPGTRIEVRNLFYNIPVRRKFLRSAGTEMGHISEAFVRLALSQLHAGFKLTHNGRVAHDVPASRGLLDRIGQFFGNDARGQLLMLESEAEGMTIGGYISDPLADNQGLGVQYLYVNGRWVRDRLISSALQEAFRGLVMTGKHPMAFLFLEVPPELVDANVHPTKSEVRFRRPGSVSGLVTQAVRERLDQVTTRTPLRVPKSERIETKTLIDMPMAFPEPASTPGESATGNVNTQRRGLSSGMASEVYQRPDSPSLLSPLRTDVSDAESVRAMGERDVSAPRLSASEVFQRPDSPSLLSPLRRMDTNRTPAIQMHNLYIIIEVAEGVLIVDQHALHERILFERLRERFHAGKLEVQRLLVPETVQMSPAQAAIVLEHVEELAQLGLEISDFGSGTLLLNGYPAVLDNRPPRDVLRAVAEQLMSGERPPSRDALLEGMMALMACHSAVRGGDRLSSEMIAELAAQRDLARDAHHCPHGRPSSLLFTKSELDRQFRRT